MPETFESAPPTAERQAFLAKWKRLSDEPAPRERREIGCMTVVVSWAMRCRTWSPSSACCADVDLYPVFTDSKVRLPD